MSKQDEARDAAETPAQDVDASFSQSEEPRTEESTEKALDTERETGASDTAPADKPSGSRGGLLGLASLLVAIVALIGVAWLFLSRETLPELDFAAPGEVRSVSESVANVAASLRDLETRVDALGQADNSIRNDLERELDDAVAELEDQLAQYESLPPRVGNLENSVAAIQGIEAGARDTLLLAEAEYYLQVGNTLLNLADNVELAKVALGMANDRLTSIGNPALDNVRQALTDEITALDLTVAPDIENSAMLLSSLARLVDSLPLKSVEGNLSGDGATAPGEEPGAAGRAWDAIREAVGGAVKVTPPGDDRAPLLVPGAQPLIRSNLSLQLEAARLALLKGEQTLFEQSLDDASNWLDLYFDGASLQVRSANDTLAEIRATAVTSDRPDISESLRLLRQYRSLSE